MVLPPHIGGEMGLSYPIFRLPHYPQDTGTRPSDAPDGGPQLGASLAQYASRVADHRVDVFPARDSAAPSPLAWRQDARTLAAYRTYRNRHKAYAGGCGCSVTASDCGCSVTASGCGCSIIASG